MCEFDMTGPLSGISREHSKTQVTWIALQINSVQNQHHTAAIRLLTMAVRSVTFWEGFV